MQLEVLPLEAQAIDLTFKQQLLSELQETGMRLVTDEADGADHSARSRMGGAGPSDHKAITIDDTTVMVPIHTMQSMRSPYTAHVNVGALGTSARLEKEGAYVATIQFPPQPRFYDLKTEEGIPYWQIATLHSHDVLATTVLQNCIRYQNKKTTCQFCAIGESLKGGRTIARKTPRQLAEVAEAAVRLDGVRHMIMTTGTPNLTDRGAGVLTESAEGVRQVTDLPIQGQCEPPDDFTWFRHMKDAGIDSLGMHLEAVEQSTRMRIMPGKASVPLSTYMSAFEEAVAVFGYGQVSTYILAGLGDRPEAILEMSERLIAMGVYPFVVPFVPISGTQLEHLASPTAAFMRPLLKSLADQLALAGMSSADMKAGCGKCGACSTLSEFEKSA